MPKDVRLPTSLKEWLARKLDHVPMPYVEITEAVGPGIRVEGRHLPEPCDVVFDLFYEEDGGDGLGGEVRSVEIAGATATADASAL